MAMSRRGRLASFVLALAVTGSMTLIAVASPALADVTCPTVDPTTKVVTPAPTPNVDWAGCDLTDAGLSGADLAGADLAGANLHGAVAENVNLSGANLSGATLTTAQVGGDLSGANLSSVSAFGLELSGSNLTSADLDGFSGAVNFTGDSLQHANLDNADLDNSNLGSNNFFEATMTGATSVNAFWSMDICPDGASSAYFTDGCLSPISVTTPSATPVVTGGTLGNNGWYTSAVTVTWFWVDSNGLAADCPSRTKVATQGVAVAITASCTDSAGHVGQGSITEQIDKTPPVVKLTGVTKGAIYPYPLIPFPQCHTTDIYSGVALQAGTTLLGGTRPDDTGVQTASCSGGTDQAGNVAPSFTVSYQVVYAFGGFTAPAPGGTLSPSAPTIDVRFALTGVSGTPIPANTAAGLATTHSVRATLRGPGGTTRWAACAWNAKGLFFECVINRPKHVLTGHRHPYSITATENLGGGWVTAPIDYLSQNPAPVYFG
jgi:hypothetical protein